MQDITFQKLTCRCRAVSVVTNGQPLLRAYCHCHACRDLGGAPMHAATIWRSDDVHVLAGIKSVKNHAFPERQMQRNFCIGCGDLVYGINRLGFRSVPNSLVATTHAGETPLRFRPTLHQFYAYRQIDVHDDLPKYLERPGSPLFMPRERLLMPIESTLPEGQLIQ